MLRLVGVTRIDRDVRMVGDQRRRADRYTAEYRDGDGIEYRVGVYVERDSTPPRFPQSAVNPRDAASRTTGAVLR
jgi:hypothetical protein